MSDSDKLAAETYSKETRFVYANSWEEVEIIFLAGCQHARSEMQEALEKERERAEELVGALKEIEALDPIRERERRTIARQALAEWKEGGER